MIRLEGLQVHTGDFVLTVDELSVAPGEYVMVLGPTASGKTVLLETVAGLRSPAGGRVWFGERDVTGEPPEKRCAGLVYQDYALFPHLSVAQNIGFGSRYRPTNAMGSEGRTGWLGRRKAGQGRVRELAGLLDIEGLLDRYPEGLSGGERQRVALARALAIEPQVLLLDEPLSALDGPTRLELQLELKRVHRELGATVMHVTHDLDEALALGDRVAVLVDGGLRQVGSPQHVSRFPEDVEVARLFRSANSFAVAAVEGDEPGGPRSVRLENGLSVYTEGTFPIPTAGRLFAVIRAEEIDMRPREDVSPEVAPGWGPRVVTGADNVLTGKIRAIQVQSVHASVEVEVAQVPPIEAPTIFTVHVLRPQVEKAGLAAGLAVCLRISPSAVHICPERARGNI